METNLKLHELYLYLIFIFHVQPTEKIPKPNPNPNPNPKSQQLNSPLKYKINKKFVVWSLWWTLSQNLLFHDQRLIFVKIAVMPHPL